MMHVPHSKIECHACFSNHDSAQQLACRGNVVHAKDDVTSMKNLNLSLKRGNIQSAAIPYTFFKKGVIVLCYVDNFLLFAQNSKLSDELFASSK